MLLSLVVMAGALGYLHRYGGGDPVRDPISRYGTGSLRGWFTVQVLAAGVAAAGVAGLLVAHLGRAAAPASWLLVGFVATRVLIPFFPDTIPGSAPTPRNRVHLLLAVCSFATVTAACFVAAGALASSAESALAVASYVCGAVMVLGEALMILPRRPVGRFLGVGERILYVGYLAWFVIIAIAAL